MAAVFALVISILSFLLSGWVAYTAYLGAPRPGLAVGRRIFFYPLPRITSENVLWGGVGFYVPISFHNRGPKGCSILEVRMIIEPQDDPTRCFDLSWSEFSGIATDHTTLQRRWQTESVAQPISLEGHSSISKTVLFAWDPRTTEDLSLSPGQYKLRLLAWTDELAEADMQVKIPFRISKEKSAEFEKNQSEEYPLTVDVPLGESRRDNNIMTRDQVDSLYG